MRAGRNRRLTAAAAGLTALAAGGALIEWRHTKRVARDPEREVLAAPPRGRVVSVRSRDGTALCAEVFGRDDATTVVLAHGWTESRSYWAYVIRELCRRDLRVVAYDLRGHGDSDSAVDGDYAIPRFGDDLEAVLAACVPGERRAVVVGHSLGAMAVVSWAEHHDVERRVGAAALINTGVGDLISEQLLVPVPRIAQAVNKTIAVRAFLGNRVPLPRFSTPLSHALVRYLVFGSAASPAQVAFFERMLITCPPQVRANVGIALSEMDLYDAIARLTVPTMVVAGAEDRLTPPSHARRIAEMTPQLERLIILPDTGHMAPLERPYEVSEALAALAARVPAGERAAA